MQSSRFILTGLTLALIVIGLAGCTGRDMMMPTGPDKDAVSATTPELLLEKVARAYADRDLECYADLLAEDFVFTFLPCDVNDLGLGSDHWGREDELISAARMFSGEPHVRGDGTVVPAITAIEVLDFNQDVPWEDAGDRRHPGTLRAVYSMKVLFVREGASDLVVDGPSIFFATPVINDDGETVFRLRGWVDQTKVCP